MSEEHLLPEELVDLLEGAPVEAEARQHLSSCAGCAGELADLRETLGILGILKERTAPAFRRYALWAGAAAAVLLAAVLLFRSEPQGTAADLQLLAPIDEDIDYEVLEALSQQLPEDETLGFPLDDFPDASELSSPELRLLLDRLAREMSSTS